ncbi:MAG TPA: cyclic nucleotide-binding domain-containing protein [Spirochaetota bacterium]|nr:cyclic nucleotide-binding domain-containing protein [Spirochaetota bacterium]HOL56627.1 cyclic nucleotide-binding domain-containing protein [Spirochaetota bacterium]HPP03740.1 cyclic nucleotide-binding domain-containing protein [Spirochaetota bacterium]
MEKRLTENKYFKKGDIIVYEGQIDSGIYYVKKGIAKNIESNILYGDGSECSHRFFGFLGSLQNKRTSTIVAETDVEILKIDFSIIQNDESLYTIVNDVLKEFIEIVLQYENRIDSLLEENKKLKEKLKGN